MAEEGRAWSPRPPDRPLAIWLRAADAVTIALLLLAVWVALTGGFRLPPQPVRLSITSWLRPLLWAGGLAFLRHVLVARPSLPARLRAGFSRLWAVPGVAAAVPVFTATRLSVLFVGFLSVATVGFQSPPAFRVSTNEAVNLGARWDSGWYLGIATHGYRWHPETRGQQNLAFFPAYPLLMRAGGFLLGPLRLAGTAEMPNPAAARVLLAGVAISLVAFLLALIHLFDLAQPDLGEAGARGAIVLLATYPFAVFYSAVYTESLFLLGVAAAFLAARRRRWAVMGAWGLLVGLTRPNGCLLSIPLAMVASAAVWPRCAWMGRFGVSEPAAVSSGRPAAGPGRLVPLVAAGMPGVGMVIHSVYVYSLTGHPLTWAAAQGAWGRGYRDVVGLALRQYQLLDWHGLLGYLAHWPTDAVNAGAALFMLSMVWPVARRLGPAYAVFLVLNVLPPLFSGGLESVGRYTSVLFPAFFALAAMLPGEHRAAWAAGFGAIQGLFAVLFFTGRQVY